MYVILADVYIYVSCDLRSFDVFISAVTLSWPCSLAQVCLTPQRQRRGGEGCGELIWLLRGDSRSYCNHQRSLYFSSAPWPCRFLFPSLPATPVSHTRFGFSSPRSPSGFPRQRTVKSLKALDFPVSNQIGICEKWKPRSNIRNEQQTGAEHKE